MKKLSPTLLYTSRFDTPLGSMVGIADEKALFLLEFADHQHLELRLPQILKHVKTQIIEDTSPPLALIEKELDAYFSGSLQIFKTPVAQFGTPFKIQVWNALSAIPYGQTRSYLKQAEMVGSPLASRAVGSANGSNFHAIIVPCHRVINTNGKLGGYGGGLWRKEWLLNHEKKYSAQ